MTTKHFSLGLWAVVASMALGTGCGLTAVSDIDRVQPNYTDKSIFDGEWHSRMVVVDKQYPNGWLFEGYEGGLDRIRWEITRDQLIAHRSYEYAPGTEQDEPGDNTVIASFRISKHFDITRQYNATNGVETNVIHENDYDNPWWARQYIRVDWSQDVSSGFDGTFWRLSGLINYLTAVPNDRNTNADPADPFKVRVSKDYIETTLDFIAYPDYSVCGNLGAEAFACQGADIKAKWSFKKVDQTDDYEPLNYPDRKSAMYGLTENAFGEQSICFEGDENCELRELWIHDNFEYDVCDLNIHDPDDCFQFTQDVFTRFGFFRTDRFAYDRENGVTLSSREQLINRWDMWKDSYDEDGELIPYNRREPKTITYHYNVGFPEGMKNATQQQADDWNVAFLDTIANLQGKTMAEVEQEYAKGDNLFRAYEVKENDCNPQNINDYVERQATTGQMYDLEMDLMKHDIRLKDLGPGNLENACAVLEHYSRKEGLAPVFSWQQLGDLRYSFINWIANPEPAGPLGYGPSAADPITGEIISANANIYGASLDTYANWGGDIVQLINEDLTVSDIVNGSHIRQYVDSVREKYAQPTDPRVGEEFVKLFDERTAHLSDEQLAPRIPIGSVNSNLDRIKATNFEEEHLLTEEAVQLFSQGANPSVNGVHDQAAMQAALPSSWGRTQVPNLFNQNDLAQNIAETNAAMENTEALNNRRELYNTEGFCFFQDEIEPAVVDLALELKDKTREEAVQIIRAGIMRGVLAHEVGHTVGLRHNFEGSSDPLNYFPGYWGVTTNDHRDSDNPRKTELEYSSIMDYHQRFNSDFAGIGLYDKAAIKFGYGQLLEVFDQREEVFVSNRNPLDAFWLFYPSDIPYLLAGTSAHDVIYDRIVEVNDEISLEGNNQEIVNVKTLGIEPKPENLFRRRNVPFKEWAKSDILRTLDAPSSDGQPHLVDVPYSYCSDGFAWGGNLTCNRFDKGATSQEILRNAAEMYDFYYPFYTYLGARSSLSMNGWLNRLSSRTYQPMRNAFTYYLFYRRSTALIYPTFLDWALAAHDGINFLGGVIQRPDVGTYCQKDGMYVPESDLASGENCASERVIPLGPGRQFKTNYTDDELYRVQNIGHVWDKIMALSAMTSADAFFYRDFSNQVDRSAFSISFYRVFHEEMNTLMTGIILDKPTQFAPQLRLDGNDSSELVTTPTVTFRDLTEVPNEGPMIKPASNNYMRKIALFWSMLNFSSQLDQTLDYSKRAKISLVGSSNDPTYEGVPEATFTDPNSLLDYHSYAVDGNEKSLGFALLTDAQDFVDNEYIPGDPLSESTLADKMEIIDLTMYLTEVLEVSN